MIAFAYDKIFRPYFNEETSNFYHSFQIICEVEGIVNSIIPDLSVSLLHRLASMHIILLLIEEKSCLDKMDSSTVQVANYCQEMLKMKYRFIFCLLYAQESKQVRLVKFNQETEDTKRPDELIQYSRTFSLIDTETNNPDLKVMKPLFRVILKTIFVHRGFGGCLTTRH